MQNATVNLWQGVSGGSLSVLYFGNQPLYDCSLELRKMHLSGRVTIVTNSSSLEDNTRSSGKN
jgi:hypothetical protein